MGLIDDWMETLTGRGAEAKVPGPADADEIASARYRMVMEQLVGGNRNISNEAVLRAMNRVPRHEFVPERLQGEAYDDRPLPIGHGQTISQPYIVAFMTEMLDPKSTDRVLEIGTGSGYQTAILAELAGEVYSVEIVPELAERAAMVLKKIGCQHVHLRLGDGSCGWPDAAPFDAILGTCAPDVVPEPLIDQLAEGGRMVIPVGRAGRQEVIVLRKHGGRLDQQGVLPVQFVPMTGRVGSGWKNGFLEAE